MSNQSNSSPPRSVLIITGPTSSGKTALAIKLAGDKPTSIISADSRQAYSGLDVISGKDIPVGFEKKTSNLVFNNHPVVYYEKDPLRLWGFDLLDPDEVHNAADFSVLSRQIIDTEMRENRQVFIVGGTGFYLKALVHPESLSPVLPNEELRRELDSLTVEELVQRLREISPQKFVSLNQSDASNPRRLIRAIEIASSPNTSHQSHSSSMAYSFSWLGLKTSLDDLKLRIGSRIRARLTAGAVFEVENLLARYPDQSLPIYTTLGIRPIIRFLAKEIDFNTLITTWITDEMNYAKRQLTWFKKQSQIIWYDLDDVR